jgi:VWFA-related protein
MYFMKLSPSFRMERQHYGRGNSASSACMVKIPAPSFLPEKEPAANQRERHRRHTVSTERREENPPNRTQASPRDRAYTSATMRRDRKRTPCCVAVLIFGFTSLSPAQQPSRQTDSSGQSNQPAGAAAPSLIRRSEEGRRRANLIAHEVVLNVLVTDAAGMAVRGLSEGDFTILDNGKPQPISFFRPAQPPHVVLLLDAVNSSRWSYAAERKAVEKFLASSSAPLKCPMAIAWLLNADIHVNPESRDPKTLLDQLRAAPRVQTFTDAEERAAATQSLDIVTPNNTAATLYEKKMDSNSAGRSERFVRSVNALTSFALQQKNVPGRCIVLWLGPGWPLLTGPGFRTDTTAERTGFFDRIADLSGDLRDAEIILDTVASPEVLRDSGLSADYYASFLSAVAAPNQASAANLALPVLAVHSGGQVFDQDRDMASALAGSLAGIRSGYMLVFQSQPSTQPDTYRPLQVTVARPGAVVRTATGYYAQP